MELEVLTELLSQVTHLRTSPSKYAALIFIENNLPEEFLDALLRFRPHLDEGSKEGPIGLFKDVTASSHPWQQDFVRVPPPNSMTSVVHIRQKSNLEGVWNGHMVGSVRCLS